MRRSAAFCFALLCGAAASADDAVGVFRVDIFSDETVEVAMPFEPLGTNSVSDFFLGDFAGDGGDGSDRLWQVSSRGGGVVQSVFANGAWIDAANGDASAASNDLFGIIRAKKETDRRREKRGIPLLAKTVI